MFWASLPDFSPRIHSLEQCLSDDETSRAARYVFAKDRDQFVLCRGLLRQFLGSYLGVDPGDILFGAQDVGKPTLAGRFGDSRIQFNISHSNQVALFGFTCDRQIGVDVEMLRSDVDVRGLADRFFSIQEREELSKVSNDLAHRAFFSCWTRKEAYVKAVGSGLQLPLDSFSVSLTPGQPVLLTGLSNDKWQIFSLDTMKDYAAAAIIEKPSQITRFSRYVAE